MAEVTTIQTGIRLDAALYNRLKINAKKERRSLNSYVVRILEDATTPVLPKIKLDDFKLDEDILSFGNVIGNIPDEVVSEDPKLRYILSK